MSDDTKVPLPGFENFGEEEYELVDMVRKAVLDNAEVITMNCIQQEVKYAQDCNGDELPQEFVDYINGNGPVPPLLNNLVSLGVYAGTQAMAMVQVAKGMINVPEVMKNQPEQPSFTDLISPLMDKGSVSIYKVGEDENGEVKITPLSNKKEPGNE